MKKISTLLAGLMLVSSVASAESVTVRIQDSYGEDLYESFTTDLTYEDGVYTFANFFNSNTPLSFTFEEPELYDYAGVEICGNVYESNGYSYPLASDGNFAVYVLHLLDNGGEEVVWYPYIYTPDMYSWVSHIDKEYSQFDYYARFMFAGVFMDNTSTGWLCLNFYFNDLKTTAIEDVNVDENAPVEFFNLNGQRVENPENGVFIRKQGNKTSKVVIR